MNRRTSIKYLIGGSAIVALGGGHLWLTKERDRPELGLDFTLDRLNEIDLASLKTSSEWEVARTFNHLAQSVEFSLDGFPSLKSELFRRTAGQLAFSVFYAQGRMTHGLNEEIPGEVVEAKDASPIEAKRRLIAALKRFDAHKGQLMPHFAYGDLDKSQYALAHVLHINNHLEEFQAA